VAPKPGRDMRKKPGGSCWRGRFAVTPALLSAGGCPVWRQLNGQDKNLRGATLRHSRTRRFRLKGRKNREIRPSRVPGIIRSGHTSSPGAAGRLMKSQVQYPLKGKNHAESRCERATCKNCATKGKEGPGCELNSGAGLMTSTRLQRSRPRNCRGVRISMPNGFSKARRS
jgi:hypothetical protein